LNPSDIATRYIFYTGAARHESNDVSQDRDLPLSQLPKLSPLSLLSRFTTLDRELGTLNEDCFRANAITANADADANGDSDDNCPSRNCRRHDS
jgi:hypothetical protein